MLPDKANLSCGRHWLARLHVIAAECTPMQPDRTSHVGPPLCEPGRWSAQLSAKSEVARRTACCLSLVGTWYMPMGAIYGTVSGGGGGRVSEAAFSTATARHDVFRSSTLQSWILCDGNAGPRKRTPTHRCIRRQSHLLSTAPATPCSGGRLGHCGKDDRHAETTCSSLPHQTGAFVEASISLPVFWRSSRRPQSRQRWGGDMVVQRQSTQALNLACFHASPSSRPPVFSNGRLCPGVCRPRPRPYNAGTNSYGPPPGLPSLS